MTDIPGRTQLDVMRIVPKMYKLDQYTLKFVAANINKKSEGLRAIRQRLYHLATHPDLPYVDSTGLADEEPPDPVEDPDTEGPDNDIFWHHEAQAQLQRLRDWDQLVTKDDYMAWDKQVTSKIDLPYHKLRPYFLAGPRSRTEIIRYCMRDTDVTHKIAADNILEQSAEAMSRLTNTDVDDLLTKGEQLKVWNKYCRIAHVDNWHLNRAYLRKIMPPHRLLERFKGGKVQEPLVGLYFTPDLLDHIDLAEPIATLDFNSLYPSINVADNNCTSSLIASAPKGATDIPPAVLEAQRLNQVVLVTTLDTGERTYTNQSCKTILPTMNLELLSERKATRKLQKAYSKSSTIWEALECKQLAQKLVNNCTFGFSGAPRGFAGCPLVAAITTAIGRNKITRTAQLASSPPFNHTVIYGDSVSGDTPLIMRDIATQRIFVSRMDELVTDEKQWQPYHADKAAVVLPQPMEVWSDGGFTKIQRVIRHLHGGPLVRVVTATGMADVTLHHSLLRGNGQVVKPDELKLGDELLHCSSQPIAEMLKQRPAAAVAYHPPDPSTLAPNTAKEAWMWGVFMAHGSCGARQMVPDQTDVWWHVTTTDEALLGEVKTCVTFPTQLERYDGARVSLTLARDAPNAEAIVWAFRSLFYNFAGEKRVPPGVLSAPTELAASFFAGYNAEHRVMYEDARARQGSWRLHGITSKEACAGLWLLAQRLGCWTTVELKTHQGTLGLNLSCGLLHKSPHALISATGVGGCGHRFVYDLETANHHFEVGPGHLVVHNTDSIMIKMHPLVLPPEERTGDKERDFRTLMIKHQEKATIVAQAASALFQNPDRPDLKGVINLDMEKLYYPYLLLGAKNYAGTPPPELQKLIAGFVLHTGAKYEAVTPHYEEADLTKRYAGTFLDPNFDPKLDMKGMAAVRRSACPIVRKLCTDMLSALLLFQDRILALTLLDKALTQLAAGKMPLSGLIRTAKLAGKYEPGKKYPAHKIVADKLHLAGSGDAPSIGARVPFIFALNGASPKDQNLRAEHPKIVLEKGYAVDLEYYVEKQLHNPIVTFAEWWVRDPDVLFEKARAQVFQHSRHIVSGGVQGAFRTLQKQVDEEAARDKPPVGGYWRKDFSYDEPTSDVEEQEQWHIRQKEAMAQERAASPLPDSVMDSDNDTWMAPPAALESDEFYERKNKRQRNNKATKTGVMDAFVHTAAPPSTTVARTSDIEMDLPPFDCIPVMDLSQTVVAPAPLPVSAATKEPTFTAVVALPRTTDHFHRNRTALEQPTSAEVLQRLRRQTKGKNKRGFGSDTKTTLTVTRFFARVPKL